LEVRATPDPDAVLPCGVAIDDLLEQVSDHLPALNPEHQSSCAHCRAMLAELTALWAPVHSAAAERITAPAALVDRVMVRVRELATHTWYGLHDGEQGLTRIAAWVVAAVARVAADRVPGVCYAVLQAGERPLTQLAARVPQAVRGVHQHPHSAGVAGRRTVISLELVADLRAPLPELANAVRRQVQHDVSTLTGLDVVEINILFTDLDVDEEG